MGKGIKKCRVCGKEYPYCKTFKPYDGTFRWQDVACCKEHGEIYLRAIMESRGELSGGDDKEPEDE